MGSEMPFPVISEVFLAKNDRYAPLQLMVALRLDSFPTILSPHPSRNPKPTTTYEVHFEWILEVTNNVTLLPNADLCYYILEAV